MIPHSEDIKYCILHSGGCHSLYRKNKSCGILNFVEILCIYESICRNLCIGYHIHLSIHKWKELLGVVDSGNILLLHYIKLHIQCKNRFQLRQYVRIGSGLIHCILYIGGCMLCTVCDVCKKESNKSKGSNTAKCIVIIFLLKNCPSLSERQFLYALTPYDGCPNHICCGNSCPWNLIFLHFSFSTHLQIYEYLIQST